MTGPRGLLFLSHVKSRRRLPATFCLIQHSCRRSPPVEDGAAAAEDCGRAFHRSSGGTVIHVAVLTLLSLLFSSQSSWHYCLSCEVCDNVPERTQAAGKKDHTCESELRKLPCVLRSTVRRTVPSSHHAPTTTSYYAEHHNTDRTHDEPNPAQQMRSH